MKDSMMQKQRIAENKKEAQNRRNLRKKGINVQKL
jgi:hypothetical protein